MAPTPSPRPVVTRVQAVAVYQGADQIGVRVFGPDGATQALDSTTLRRIFGGRAFTRERRARLSRLVQFHAHYDGTVVGVAGYTRQDDRLVVVELGLDRHVPDAVRLAVLSRLLGAVELAALAGGARLVLLAPAAVCGVTPLEHFGYRLRPLDLQAPWLEKNLP
jgi:hypothetical protein